MWTNGRSDSHRQEKRGKETLGEGACCVTKFKVAHEWLPDNWSVTTSRGKGKWKWLCNLMMVINKYVGHRQQNKAKCNFNKDNKYTTYK